MASQCERSSATKGQGSTMATQCERSSATKGQGSRLSGRHTVSSLQKTGVSAANLELKDMLERKIEDLSRQLAEERQTSRQNKMATVRLQRELARAKSPGKSAPKEHLSREVEHEKMLRLEAERRLHEMTRENEACHSRLENLQAEFLRMESVVQDMRQYKSKIDQLRHEKTSLSSTYETNLQKFKGHITDLERENMVLLNEVKKLESQMSSKAGSQDRYRLLLERLKMVETENSSLVLENEQQRGQYEKCLDEIANQVVQALLAQKMLREECVQLQERVQELESQNKHLCIAYSARVHSGSDSNSQDGGVFVAGSLDSLHSMFSEQTADGTGGHQMSSPPPWLQDRLPGDRHSLVSFTGSVMSTPDMDTEIIAGKDKSRKFKCRTEIETEFPATPSSPKSKHVSIMERTNDTKRSSSTSSLLPLKVGPNRQRTRSTSSLTRAHGLTSAQTADNGSHDSGHSTMDKSTTNQTSQVVFNQGISTSSMSSSGNQRQTSMLQVPKDYSSSFANSQGQMQTSQTSISSSSSSSSVFMTSSKIPVLPVGSTKEDLQLRRNSLKAEYSIRLGSQTAVTSNTPSPKPSIPTLRPPRPSSQGQRSIGGQGNTQSRPPSASGRSQSAGSKIPSVFSKPARTSSKENVSKLKSTSESAKPVTNSKSGSNSKPLTNVSSTMNTGSEKYKCATTSLASKLIPPKSPIMKHSGIKTSLKSPPPGILLLEQDSKSTNSTAIQNAQAALKSVYCIKSVPPAGESKSCKQESAKPALPVRGYKPVHSHFPIMGLNTLNHTSPKSEESATQIYENVQTPVNCVSPNDNQCTFKSTTDAHVSNKSVVITNVSIVSQSGPLNYAAVSGRFTGNFIDTETCMAKKPNYFYDYSDEDSDCPVTRSPSKDFGSVSTISLEELLDRTLENMDTPNGSEFSSGYLAYNSTQMLTESVTSDNSSDVTLLKNYEVVKSADNTNTLSSSNFGENVPSNIFSASQNVGNNLGGKPDIVKDTEHSQQKNLQKNIPVSEIPGSSLPGYRAKRPKSLILGSKEKKFLYCEYGSSSGSDSSENEHLSCKVSYAKNVKEQEIQSKVSKCVKNGQAKVIESPKSAKSTLKCASNVPEVKNEKDDKVQSLISKPSAIKKPSKIPPPVASKPVSKMSSIPKIAPSTSIQRPKSVEMVVNTALTTHKSKLSGYFESPNPKDLTKAESEHSISSKMKLSSSDLNSNTTFEDIKVERSGSKDDGYSTMSSDIQPEMLEKYSDAFDSSTNSNEARNSNLSLSSQNSYSSEDRLSGHGSLGRVKAMKLKFELENQRSDTEVSPTKSPPLSPAKSLLKSPKPVSEKFNCKEEQIKVSEHKPGSNLSKLQKPKSGIAVLKENTYLLTKQKCAIPVPAGSTKPPTTKLSHKVEINIEPKVEMAPKEVLSPQSAQRKSFPITNPNYVTSTPVRQVSLESPTTPKLSPIQPNISPPHIINHLVPTNGYVDQFDKLTFFENIELLKDSNFDSNGSLSDRASDLTSLHISEDNMLSDIPEEKDGYESSLGVMSENTSFSSLPTVNMVKKSPQHTQTHTNAHHNAQRHQFTHTLKRYWSSCSGIVRAATIFDYEKQKKTKETADYEELYGGCLNIETLLERASSESDMYTRGDKPLVNLLPRLHRSLSADNIRIDEIAVEERVQAILKQFVLTQISQNVESADRDGESFTSFVELLIKRGHVMEPLTPKHENDISTSNFSSKGNNSCSNTFASEERTEMELPPLGEDQKRFNSQFYSLCNTGSNRSISDKTDSGCNDMQDQTGENKSAESVNLNSAKSLVHTCHKGDRLHCKKCEHKRNIADFDHISKKIESLSKTVNELHRSLSSLNSENSEASCSESNEGDFPPQNAIGNKDIDGYAWVEDEFFLSPYDGEIILGSSPFSKTGASCDWMDNYVEDADNLEEVGGQEAPLDDSVFELPEMVDPVSESKTSKDIRSHNEKFAQTRRSIISDCVDDQGNFDSESFISQRLHQEEARLKSEDTRAKLLQFSQDMDISVPIQNLRSSMACSGLRSRPLPHGSHQASVEHDDVTDKHMYDSVYPFDVQPLTRSGSQDSMDDNIGVDNVMCHRLLGGSNTPVQRSALEFTNSQFLRYEDPEKQAIAAFDFLHEMTSSVTSHASDQSQKQSQDQQNSKSSNEIKKSRIPLNFRTHKGQLASMNQSTTSTDDQLSPVKRQRRKVKRGKKETGNSRFPGKVKARKCSSTSNDESNDASATDSSSEEEIVSPKHKLSSKMTYL
ncbi:microtubule-associated protein futsch-like isoform X2 [Dreissena polymorpha]|nr:microtubule-associated protein futsch-like isoform X2 [Dreissena polymorpha]